MDNVTPLHHRADPDTSRHAAARSRTQSERIKRTLRSMLHTRGPATAKELHADYQMLRRSGGADIPDVDVYEIRRRLSEMKVVDGTVVDTGGRRDRQSVLGLVEESAWWE